MILAAIFDFDGLLVDTEPLWRRAEVTEFNLLGVPLTTSMCDATMGLRIDEVVAYWHERYPWPDVGVDLATERILDRVQDEVEKNSDLHVGAADALQAARSLGLVVGLASSSPLRIINSALDRFQLSKFFDGIHSAEHELKGKPDPAVYLSAARNLQVHPEDCLAIEDSLVGVTAAKSAGMRCVAIPPPPAAADGVGLADAAFADLMAFADALPALLHWST